MEEIVKKFLTKLIYETQHNNIDWDHLSRDDFQNLLIYENYMLHNVVSFKPSLPILREAKYLNDSFRMFAELVLYTNSFGYNSKPNGSLYKFSFNNQYDFYIFSAVKASYTDCNEPEDVCVDTVCEFWGCDKEADTCFFICSNCNRSAFEDELNELYSTIHSKLHVCAKTSDSLNLISNYMLDNTDQNSGLKQEWLGE